MKKQIIIRGAISLFMMSLISVIAIYPIILVTDLYEKAPDPLEALLASLFSFVLGTIATYYLFIFFSKVISFHKRLFFTTIIFLIYMTVSVITVSLSIMKIPWIVGPEILLLPWHASVFSMSLDLFIESLTGFGFISTKIEQYSLMSLYLCTLLASLALIYFALYKKLNHSNSI